jgi:uncharacterized membrane protein YhaH (DUF805 family)
MSSEMSFFVRLWYKAKGVLTSRKFWAFVGALAAIASAYFGGEIVAWEAIQAIVAAVAVYMGATAYEDAARQ